MNFSQIFYNYSKQAFLSLQKSLFILFLILLFTPAQAQLQEYTLGPGDIINISVFQESELSYQVKLGDSGVISYPFIGEIQVTGKSTNSIENTIEQLLISGEFLIRPDVTVSVVEYRPFYIDGEVQNPGSYPYEPGLTLRNAISIAGGFTERGSRTKISIISNIDQASKPEDILNTLVFPDDTITVNGRFF